MLIKKVAITAAAGAIMLASAAGAFAHHGGTSTEYNHSFNTSTKTVTVTKADIHNDAHVSNMVFTAANTGLNDTTVSGGATTANTTSGEAEKGGTSGATGGAVTGGNVASVTTGDAGAASFVSNSVNTTTVTF